MNEQKPIDTGITEVKPQEVPEVRPANRLLQVFEKIPQPVRNVFNRFYSNKKIFWPITIAFGSIFLIIILGLLFGNRNPNQIVTKIPSPTPFTTSTPVASPSGDFLGVTKVQLEGLNNQINSLDVKQSILKPPSIDYNINF